MDDHGYFSLGTNAEYISTFIGKAPFFLKVNRQMSRTFGGNHIHLSQVKGTIDVDRVNYHLAARVELYQIKTNSSLTVPPSK